ncbi:TonB-dependent receptor [Shewanella violacea]|uniref:TonB-dependent receptor n=1 Tax=Shewanella violacea (strain JCM 10179 / CIP 106290 / LMG 19151 / DSS12) TaxID=637905 RepID=D4ZCH5_SHEVD|nr:TonB-dependent receptor [Shewanella violacea]BAJ03720.1 TonB-dependent receptor [Shewanella violacea DSS12]
MTLRLSIISLSIFSALFSSSHAFADDAGFEVIEVTGHHEGSYSSVAVDAVSPKVDISGLLEKIPGAAVNGNGPLTGIAQYRGLYGNRVNTQVNGVSLASAGPNAMDTPLSYASLVNSERLEMTRGIAPVSAGTDTIGGSVKVIESQASFDDVSGKVAAQYQDNGQRGHVGAKVNIGNQDHALLVYGDILKGDDNTTSGNGREISPTTYDKNMFGGQYRFNLGASSSDNESIAIGYQHVETTEAGTPALPMDIDFIRSDRVKLEGVHDISDWELNWHLAYSDAEHGMDNFNQRMKMPSMNARYNSADSTSFDGQLSIAKDAWLFGLDTQLSEHNSVITDPTMAMFHVDNFNGVKNDTYTAFAQWQLDVGQWNWQLGARVKHYITDADEVEHSMAGKKPAIKMLMDRYNNADRSQSQTGVDLVLNTRYQVSNELSWILGLARKQASASYQQRYLWVPMQSTGGLADGRTYVGQMDLDLETAYQVEVGADYANGDFSFSPRVFLHRIDNYIQGVAATNQAVIMAAKMMGDNNPMQFANVDAQLLGMDLSAAYQLAESWSLDMNASYVSGERRDIEDNLYRIAPPKVILGLNYLSGSWLARVEALGVSAQNKVSETQLEETTAGYGLMNLSLAYDADSWMVKAGVNNLFDTEYEDHLAGYNRVMGGDLMPGERMPGTGINAWLTGEYRF